MKHYEENYNECINELYEQEQLLRGKEITKPKKVIKKSSFIKAKKDIKIFPLHQASQTDRGSWIFPQILAHFGSKKLVFKESKVSPSLTLESWNLSLEEKTWLDLITSSPRSNFLSSSKYPRYSQSVPLALSAFKTYQDLSYEAWDFRDHNIRTFLEPLHVELLEFRTNNLPDPQTLSWNTLEKKLETWLHFGTWESNVLGSLPRLAVHIYTQTWLWHPTKIHPLAIQSLKNWDQPENSLHSSTIF